MLMLRRQLNILIIPLVLFAIVYSSLDLFVMFLEIRLHCAGLGQAMGEMLFRFHRGIVMVSACVVAACRIVLHHPQFKPAYRQWLMTTPWTSGMPLPLGRVTIDWTDALRLTVIVVTGWLHSGISPMQAMIAYFLAYVAVAGFALLMTVHTAAVPLAFGGAVAAWLIPESTPTFFVAAALFIVANLLVWRSLWAFPWGDPPTRTSNVGPGNPFQQLSPKQSRLHLSISEGILLSLLVGCWACALMSHVPLRMKIADLLGIMFWSAGAVAFGRLFFYIAQGVAPISIAGRFVTGRIIIPGHDKIFVAPLCAVAVVAIIPQSLRHLGLPWHLWFGITTTFFTAALLCIGPTLPNWRLFGACGIRRTANTQLYIGS
jgi:hypothetical protein